MGGCSNDLIRYGIYVSDHIFGFLIAISRDDLAIQMQGITLFRRTFYIENLRRLDEVATDIGNSYVQ
ncbi:hypothetical protein RW26_04930 [Aeromonas sp. L_1B5_3]|nr:hypothetical protein RW26_04930 [Aeromonas sp. L_1B5_3]